MQVNKILLVLSMLFLISCGSKEFDSEEALWEYLKNKENGYMLTKTVNGVDFSLVYRPTDLLVQQELSQGFDANQVDSLRNKYKNYLYFNLSMSKAGQEVLNGFVGNKQKFGAMVNQLAFGMGEKVHVYNSKKDTIAMANYIYPRMYGMSNSTTMMFVYPRDKKLITDKSIHFTIEDLGLFTGEVKFKIPTKLIHKEPTLAL